MNRHKKARKFENSAYYLEQGCTTQISWRTRIFFIFMFKGQNLQVFTFLKDIFKE